MSSAFLSPTTASVSLTDGLLTFLLKMEKSMGSCGTMERRRPRLPPPPPQSPLLSLSLPLSLNMAQFTTKLIVEQH
jgi:hypothetical protein